MPIVLPILCLLDGWGGGRLRCHSISHVIAAVYVNIFMQANQIYNSFILTSGLRIVCGLVGKIVNKSLLIVVKKNTKISKIIDVSERIH